MHCLLKFMLVSWVVFLLPLVVVADDSPLLNVHQQVIKSYPGVNHIGTQEVEHMLEADANGVILFDVRKPKEYAVSHIKGAIYVSPKIGQKEFLNLYGDTVKGKTVVFYCSVGHRSSKLSKRVQDALHEKGAIQSYNMKGGLFAWHNELRPLENAQSETQLIHPYNRRWGKLVDRKSLTSYSPPE
ncbi:MAG: sulfurtransferase [Gammaproteobacteria bacterium]|nr:rhodanese-like domain-containing protein [bacterium AH-315-E07]PCH61135.1 MAG: sulfurtransferase [Gammaproteobacteria bacterium]